MSTKLLSQPARAIGASLLRGQSDERLIDLTREGHEDAYAAIVRRHRPGLLRYCTRIVGADRAEDAVQQAFISAHKALLRDERDIALKPWLHRIAHNAALRQLRGDERLSDLSVDLVAANAASAPQEVADLRDRLRRTIAAIEQLPPAQRDAVLMQAFEGATHDEVAVALGITPGAARQQLHRARSSLRTAVTCVTPLPILTNLMAAGGGGAQAAGWAIAANSGSAGIGAATLKIGTGLAVTAAVAGGGVQSGLIDAPTRGVTHVTVRASPPPANGTPASAIPVAAAEELRGREQPAKAQGQDPADQHGPEGTSKVAANRGRAASKRAAKSLKGSRAERSSTTHRSAKGAGKLRRGHRPAAAKGKKPKPQRAPNSTAAADADTADQAKRPAKTTATTTTTDGDVALP